MNQKSNRNLNLPINSSDQEPFAPLEYYTQGQRIIAFIIDVIIYVIIVELPGLLLLLISGKIDRLIENTLSYLLVAVVIILLFAFPAYFIYCEYKWGWTLGKKILGIKVFMENGEPCKLKAALIRNLVLFAYFFLPAGLVLFITDLILMMKTRKKQRIGDFLAHTVVINVGQKHLQQTPYSWWVGEETYPKITSIK